MFPEQSPLLRRFSMLEWFLYLPYVLLVGSWFGLGGLVRLPVLDWPRGLNQGLISLAKIIAIGSMFLTLIALYIN